MIIYIHSFIPHSSLPHSLEDSDHLMIEQREGVFKKTDNKINVAETESCTTEVETSTARRPGKRSGGSRRVEYRAECRAR